MIGCHSKGISDIVGERTTFGAIRVSGGRRPSNIFSAKRPTHEGHRNQLTRKSGGTELLATALEAPFGVTKVCYLSSLWIYPCNPVKIKERKSNTTLLCACLSTLLMGK